MDNKTPNDATDQEAQEYVVTEKTYEGGNLLADIKRDFAENRTEKRFRALLHCLRDSYLDIPCKKRISDEDLQQLIKLKEGDTIQFTDDLGMTPDILISNATQERCFPVFSQMEQIPEDYRSQFSYLRMHFTDICEMVKNFDVNCIVVDPFTVSFKLDEELQKIVLEFPSLIDKKEASED